MTEKDQRPADATSTKPEQRKTEGERAKESFNVVTDLVAGPNLRLKDNLYQGAFVSVCLMIGIIVGLVVVPDRLMGVILGAIGGLLAGVLLSGVFLMIFRAVKHSRGKHD